MFEDKKAREAIEQMRMDLASADTDWSLSFPPGEGPTVIAQIRELRNVQSLILKHLNLEYVAETGKTEPAKLVELVGLEVNEGNITDLLSRLREKIPLFGEGAYEEAAPKPKRKYTKRKKSKK